MQDPPPAQDADEAPRPPDLPGRRFGIKAQLVLWWSTLVVVVLVGTGLVVYQQRVRFLQQHLEDEGVFVCRSLARILVHPLLEQNYGQLLGFVREQADAGLVDYACLQELDGRILAEAGKVSMKTLEAEVYGRTARERLRFEPLYQQPTYLEGRRFLEVSTLVAPEGMPAMALVRVGFDTAVRIDEPVDEGLEQLLLVFVGAIPLGILLSLVLAWWIARPVSTLVQGAEAIAGGDFDHRVEVESPRELAVLARSFDHMRLRVQQHLREIQAAYDRLDRKVYELEVLCEVAKRMNFKSYSPELLSYLLDTAIDALGAEWGSLMMADEEEPKGLSVHVVRGAGFDQATAVRLLAGEGIAGTVLETGEPIIANDGSADARFVHKRGQEDFERHVRNLICVPLMIESQPIGVFNLANKQGAEGFTPADLDLLTALAAQTARSLENAKLYDQAIRESKTGLFVPRFFEARVREELVASRRYSQVFSLVVLDIDHFKKVNDTYGHLAGDDVLIKLAKFVLRTLREDIDVASRFGGEEFALMLPKTDGRGAAQVAERLRRLVEAEMEDEANGIPHVTISVGVATFPEDGSDQEELFKVADEALYEAKEHGRNQVRVGRTKERYQGPG